MIKHLAFYLLNPFRQRTVADYCFAAIVTEIIHTRKVYRAAFRKMKFKCIKKYFQETKGWLQQGICALIAYSFWQNQGYIQPNVVFKERRPVNSPKHFNKRVIITVVIAKVAQVKWWYGKISISISRPVMCRTAKREVAISRFFPRKYKFESSLLL